MILTFRPIRLWPAGWDRSKTSRPPHPFETTWLRTLELLNTELGYLGAREVVLQVDADERDVRLDGQLRADAKVAFPGVILSFATRAHGTLTYQCDAFGPKSYRSNLSGWQANVRAIGLGLHDLRRLERYGIAQRGQQYAGWAELPAVAMGGRMTIEEAARFLAAHAEAEEHFESNVAGIMDDLNTHGTDVIDLLFKRASRKLHPDHGGDAEQFKRLVQARDLLVQEARAA